jgi:hypothetical protein
MIIGILADSPIGIPGVSYTSSHGVEWSGAEFILVSDISGVVE